MRSRSAGPATSRRAANVLLAIDPGESSGLAWFDRGVLVSAYATTIEQADGLPVVPLDVVIEIPQIYPHSKSNPNDILRLAITAGRWIERVRGARIREVLPRAWKGQTPKPICHDRAFSRLAPSEAHVWRGIVGKGSADVRDAVSLGLWALGRK